MLARAKSPDRRAELEAELSLPPIPPGAAHVWDWFVTLASSVEGPISFPDIAAWARLMRLAPDPWEIALINDLDSLRRKVASET